MGLDIVQLRRDSGEMKMIRGTVLTGATGYVGSHLAVQLLKEYPEQHVICIARPKGELDAARRVLRALRTAHRHSGAEWSLNDHLERVFVIEDKSSFNGSLRALLVENGLPGLAVDSFWHCAASIKFGGSQGPEIWRSNVETLNGALSMATQANAHVFNHVSTAYVAGARSGRIPEADGSAPDAFNNLYEESKHTGEQMVRAHCEQHRMAYRILRPSIIIGHSQTFKTSSRTGFYQWIDALRAIREKVQASDSLYFDVNPLRVRCDRNATLDLIPIDLVVAELMDINRGGEQTFNQVFHITSESPVSVHDLLQKISSLLGIRSVAIVDDHAQLSLVDRLLDKQVRAFTPYLTQRKVFERRNAARHGMDRHQMGYLLDMGRMETFAKHYLAESVTDGGGDWSGDGAGEAGLSAAGAAA
jgi:nucleoside-diphosphate-sugar epimerase